MTKQIRFENVEACDVFDDNNNGYIHGLYWFDEHDNIIDCQWFKTTKERTQFKKDFNK